MQNPSINHCANTVGSVVLFHVQHPSNIREYAEDSTDGRHEMIGCRYEMKFHTFIQDQLAHVAVCV